MCIILRERRVPEKRARMRILQKAGHTPIVLVGGATARIGDPSGKQTARPMLSIEEIDANAASLKAQLSRFISADNAHFVNNADWLCNLGYIELLREVGTIFSVNRMLGQESVKMRLETGLSFLEYCRSNIGTDALLPVSSPF